MENLTTAELFQKIKALEEKVQTGLITSDKNFTSTAEERKSIMDAISELKDIVQSLDKETAIQAEKQSHLYYQITQLEKTVESMRGLDMRDDDRQKDLIEKIFMAVLGASITYIFSLLKQK